MPATPEIVTRAEQPYAAIKARVPMSELGAFAARTSEVFAWLGARGVALAGRRKLGGRRGGAGPPEPRGGEGGGGSGGEWARQGDAARVPLAARPAGFPRRTQAAPIFELLPGARRTLARPRHLFAWRISISASRRSVPRTTNLPRGGATRSALIMPGEIQASGSATSSGTPERAPSATPRNAAAMA